MTLSKHPWCVALAAAAMTATAPAAQITGPDSSASPYVIPSHPAVTTMSLLTVGDDADPGAGIYRLVGIPDGMGAYDNGDGTITILMNHELGSSSGVIRDHGSRGAFVSKMVVNKATKEVVGGDDLVKSVRLWNTATGSYDTGTTAMNRLCSADLPAASALRFNDGVTQFGTGEKIFFGGEETSGGKQGRGFAHVVTGPEAGVSYQLPRLGRVAYENIVLSPFEQRKTVAFSMDDADRTFSSEGSATPSELYLYVGTKLAAGNDVERAGLTNGNLYGLKLAGLNDENSFAGPTAFSLVNFGDVSGVDDGADLQADSIGGDPNNPALTQFRRIEDGAWDPRAGKQNDFYFVTTDRFGGNSKLWKAGLNNVTDPTLGGTMELVLEGAANGIEMMDNITIDPWGRVFMQEDPGGNNRLAKIWLYDLDLDQLIEVAHHDPAFFMPGEPGFLTNNEEASGIIPAFDLLGPGWYLMDVQAHHGISGELVEGGQMLAMFVPQTASIPEPTSLAALGLGAVLLWRRRRGG